MMRKVLQTISWLACAGTILPSIFYLFATANIDLTKWLMLLATVVWCVVTPLWMGREDGRMAPESQEAAE
jgi:hypothetical protein